MSAIFDDQVALGIQRRLDVGADDPGTLFAAIARLLVASERCADRAVVRAVIWRSKPHPQIMDFSSIRAEPPGDAVLEVGALRIARHDQACSGALAD